MKKRRRIVWRGQVGYLRLFFWNSIRHKVNLYAYTHIVDLKFKHFKLTKSFIPTFSLGKRLFWTLKSYGQLLWPRQAKPYIHSMLLCCGINYKYWDGMNKDVGWNEGFMLRVASHLKVINFGQLNKKTNLLWYRVVSEYNEELYSCHQLASRVARRSFYVLEETQQQPTHSFQLFKLSLMRKQRIHSQRK